ncbi:MAG: hypothetical protein U0805_17390 [Pirellulales bacterium]
MRWFGDPLMSRAIALSASAADSQSAIAVSAYFDFFFVAAVIAVLRLFLLRLMHRSIAEECARIAAE